MPAASTLDPWCAGSYSKDFKKVWLQNYYYGIVERMLRTEACTPSDNRSPGSDEQVLSPVGVSSSKEAEAASP